jgi:4-amino-4-deoxy-L-arabinose transferase-like glycosyltransferase
MASIILILFFLVGVILIVSNYKNMEFNLIWFLPMMITALCLIWALITHNFTTFEQHRWASIPVLFVIPINIAIHVFLIFAQKNQRIPNVVYALIHLGMAFVVLIISLMLVTHDSI